jgi:YD repeat-containing protein
LRVEPPGNAGATTYAYEGNEVLVTDAAGKWKRFTVDVFGNLVKVTEPRPGGGTYLTHYSYSWRNQLLTVSMPRDGTTQARTFGYDDWGRMTSATQPENGTTTYVYL